MMIRAPLKVFEQIDHGIFRVAVPFRLAGGLVDTFTHMMLVRLESGNSVALATVDVDGPAKTVDGGDTASGLIRADIDKLTDNGAKLEAVVATHSFHTVAYPSFYKAYPKAKYYGCPRHLRNQPEIPWAGTITDCEVQALWSPEIRFAIPPAAVGEFSDPADPATNHWNSVLALAGRTLFNDDMISYRIHPKQLMGRIFVWVAGGEHEQLAFHGSMFHGGLRQNGEAPGLFVEWLEGLMEQWEFDIIATAHNGVLKRDGKSRLIALLEETKPKLEHCAAKWAKGEVETKNDPDDPSKSGGWSNNPRECECG